MKIVRTRRYLKDLKRIGASDADVSALEQAIVSDPTAGVAIRGLRGIRKIRFRVGTRGKSGGGRAVYYLLLSDDAVAMMFAYAKNEQEDLSSEQRKAALAFIREIEND